MLAYSTIANGLHADGVPGGLNGYSAAISTWSPTCLPACARSASSCCCANGFEADQLDDFKGLNRRSPWWAFIMLLVMFSLAGVPPTVGFYAKFSVLQAAVEAGFTWLAVVAVLASLVGAFYYLRIVKLMYFDEPIDTAPIAARGDNQVLLSTNDLALLLFGILPQPLMGLCVVALSQSGFL
jgi:NADH-quinone oxidoreductase subunit N